MTQFEEAMEELMIPDDATPHEKLSGVCQWILGDGGYAHDFISWAEQAGYEVKEREQK